jgi:hypothetical protein
MSRPIRKKSQRRNPVVRPQWRILRLTAILLFLCLAILAVGFAAVGNAQGAFGQSSQATSTCNPTLVTTGNQAPPQKWFSINTGSAADVLSAIQCTDMFQSAAQGSDLIAYALQNGTLADPVLVKPYRSDVGLAQFWVVPVVDTNNYPLALLTFIYNPTARLIHEGEFDAVTNDMFYVTRSFPAITADMAVAAVVKEHHVAMLQGQAPELIYFPGDHIGLIAGKNNWSAGGTTVIDPIWRVPGVDGVWHYVDHDGHVHLNTAIPVDPTYQPMPSLTAIQ